MLQVWGCVYRMLNVKLKFSKNQHLEKEPHSIILKHIPIVFPFLDLDHSLKINFKIFFLSIFWTILLCATWTSQREKKQEKGFSMWTFWYWKVYKNLNAHDISHEGSTHNTGVEDNYIARIRRCLRNFHSYKSCKHKIKASLFTHKRKL